MKTAWMLFALAGLAGCTQQRDAASADVAGDDVAVARDVATAAGTMPGDEGQAQAARIAPSQDGVRIGVAGDATPPAARTAPVSEEYARASPAEQAVLAPTGGMGRDSANIVHGDGFAPLLDDLAHAARDPGVAARRDAYRDAIAQIASEVGDVPPQLRFECGHAICAGVFLEPPGSDWTATWRNRLMEAQVAPISTFVASGKPQADGSIERRFLFTTSGPGRVEVRGDRPR